MRTTLRKIGNSMGMIVPKALLTEIGVAAGTPIELRVENGKLVGDPVRKVREGWAEAAAALGEPTEEERDWLEFDEPIDGEWKW
jgi:antitoxin MazE